MTYYICNRRRIECGGACGGKKYDWFCDTTTDYNYALHKGNPMTFLVHTVFRTPKELINKGPASLFEVPYMGTDVLDSLYSYLEDQYEKGEMIKIRREDLSD